MTDREPEPTAGTNSDAYAERLTRLGGKRWKRLLDVQAPYRWNLRRLDLGFTLDVGCGLGRNLDHLGGNGVGIDHNAACVAACRVHGSAAYAPAEFEQSIDARAARFDSLLVSHVLEHLSTDDASDLIATYLPYVKPRGRVVVITPQEAGQRSDPTHVRFVDGDATRQMMAGFGWRVVTQRSFPFPRPVGKVFRHNEFVVVCEPDAAIVSGEPRLTFAVPFYRNVDYLRRAVDSVLAQSCEDWRVVVCDDAGPDAAAADVVGAYADERITYTRNATNLGIGGNWNRCLGLATTELVTLLHADDELLPGYTATVVRAHEEFPNAVAVYPRAIIIDATGGRTFSAADIAKRVIEPRSERAVLTGEAGLERLMRGQTVFCPALCYRRSLLDPAPFSTRWGMVLDLALLAQFLLDDKQLVGLREVEYAYRRHPASQSAELTENTQRFREELALFDEIATQAEARGWTRAARTAHRKRIVRLHLAFRATVDVVHGRGRAAHDKFDLIRGK